MNRYIEISWWNKYFAYVCFTGIQNGLPRFWLPDDWFRRYSAGQEPARYGVPMIVENYR